MCVCVYVDKYIVNVRVYVYTHLTLGVFDGKRERLNVCERLLRLHQYWKRGR